jgi:predicted enzyme related to lactoylglutathione lyase
MESPNSKNSAMNDTKNTLAGIGFKDVAFFGYAVTDFKKAKRFYGDILGLKETVCLGDGENIGWMEYDLAGQTLALALAFEHWRPAPGGGQVCLEVRDLDSAVSYLKRHEVHIVQDVQDFPHCRLALISDPDGNTLTLHQKKADHPDFEKS